MLAFLITTYDQPEHLGRLVRRLAGPRSRLIIHVDRKIDETPFLKAVDGVPNVSFLKERIRVNWMGFSQVASTLELLREALLEDFEHCILLSGSDYPIKSLSEIQYHYEHSQEQLLSFWRLEDRPSWWRKVEYWHPVDLVPIHGWAKRTETSFLKRFFWGRYFKYQRHLFKRRIPRGLVLYGGSDWWSLTHDAAKYALEYCANNPWFLRFFRGTLCPSDLFFQTLVLNSPFEASVRRLSDYEEWSRSSSAEEKLSEECMLPESSFNLRFVDWSGERDGGRDAPAVLDMRDWAALSTSECLFARKFHSTTSSELLQKIDDELLGMNDRS